MSRSAIYRRVTAFRRVFGEHPDVYRMPGVTLDVGEYLAHRPGTVTGKQPASEGQDAGAGAPDGST